MDQRPFFDASISVGNVLTIIAVIASFLVANVKSNAKIVANESEIAAIKSEYMRKDLAAEMIQDIQRSLARMESELGRLQGDRIP